MARIHQVRVSPSWMDPIVSFLKDDVLPEEKSEAEKIRRKAPRFWLSEDHKLYSAPILGHTYYAYTLKHQSCYSKSCMREFVGVTQEEGRWHTEPSLKDAGGQVCRKRPNNMPRSAINAISSLQISTNREGSLIPSPVLGHSLNGAWIL